MIHERGPRILQCVPTSMRPSAAALALLAGLARPPAPIASAGAPGLAGSGEEGRFECSGVRSEEEMGKLADPSARRLLGFEPLPVLLDETVTSRDSLYILGLLRTIHPYIEAVLGPPLGLDTLGIVIDTTLVTGAFASGRTIFMPQISGELLRDTDGDGSIDEDPYNEVDDDGDGLVDEDPDNSPRWDNIFIHETTHTWQRRLINRGLVTSWLIEGFAMASEYFVAREAEEEGCDRAVGGGDAGGWVASIDAVDQAGPQVLGGSGSLVARADSWTGYRNAGAVLILPALAEMAAGRGNPHPIRRLARELEIEAAKTLGRDFWGAFDRAWCAPVDGILPPSRWVRARAIACPSTRIGSFLALLPFGEQGIVDPDRMNLLLFERTGLYTHRPIDGSGEAVITGARGGSIRMEPRQNVLWLGDPLLPPGAYLMEANEIGAAGEALTAHNWILVTFSKSSAYREGGTAAVIFAGPDGRPYDPPDLRTNSNILEWVPGGVLVELPGGGSLSLRSGDRLLGEVTVPDRLPRTAIVRTSRGKADGVVAWTPYRPASGEPVTVSLRRSESALEQEETDVVLFGRGGPYDRSSVRIPLHADPEIPDVFAARFVLPENENWIVFRFEAGRSRHGDASDGPVLLRSYALPLEERRAADLLSARVLGDRLTIMFDAWANPSRFRLTAACETDGEWRERPDPPLPVDERSTVLTWALPGGREAGCRYRVWEKAGGEERLLASVDETGPGTGERSPVCSEPLPNPSRGEMRWRIESSRSIAARLEVFDASGRKVYGPEEVAIDLGTTVIDGSARPALRALPSGVYFLRLEGPGFVEKRKAVVLR